jgi:hypothetical protein
MRLTAMNGDEPSSASAGQVGGDRNDGPAECRFWWAIGALGDQQERASTPARCRSKRNLVRETLER